MECRRALSEYGERKAASKSKLEKFECCSSQSDICRNKTEYEKVSMSGRPYPPNL